MIGLVLHLPKFMVYMVFLLAWFSVLAERLAGKNVSDMTYIVSGTLKLNQSHADVFVKHVFAL